jgi:hypothetical protein
MVRPAESITVLKDILINYIVRICNILTSGALRNANSWVCRLLGFYDDCRGWPTSQTTLLLRLKVVDIARAENRLCR